MADIQGILRARFQSYDPDLDISPGGLIDTVIIQPVVRALSVDPLLTDTKQFLLQKFIEAFPNDPVSEGDALNDVLINALSLFLDAYRLELNRIKTAQSITNYDQMSNTELDRLAANWLVYRKQGSRSFGTVRVIVNRLAPISVTQSIVFTAKNGKTFTPTISYTVPTNQLMTNSIGSNQYFIDIEVRAQTTGINGNIDALQIDTASGIPSVVSVYNQSQFTGGADSDSNENLSSTRLLQSVTERSLVTARGIIAKLDSLPSVKRSQVVGFGDSEMKRDQVSVSGLGSFIGMGVAYFEDNLILINLGVKNVSLSIGNIVVNNIGEQFTIDEILGSDNNGMFLNGGSTFVVRILDKITNAYCSDISVFTKASVDLNGERFYGNTSIGGRSDVYIDTSDDQVYTTSVPLNISHSDISGVGVEINNTYVDVTNSLSIKAKDIRNKYLIISGPNLTFSAKIYAFKIHDTFIRIYLDFVTNQTLSVSSAVWSICETISIPLTESFTTVYPLVESDDDLFVYFNLGESKIRTTVDLRLTTIKVGDFIHIEDADFYGDYQITSIQQNVLTISISVPATSGRLAATIRRSVSSLPIPTSYVESVKQNNALIPYNKLLGLHTESIGGSKVNESGTGFVSGSLFYALKEVLTGLTDIRTSLKVMSPSIISEFIQEQIPHDITIDDSVSILSFGSAKSLYADVVLPNDMLLPNTNNIFIALGDVTSSNLNDDYPVMANDGDILTILNGENAGKYVINQVFQVKIPILSNNITKEGNLVTIKRSRTQSSSDNRASWRLVSIVRIYGTFKSNIFSSFEESFRLTEQSSTEVSGYIWKRYVIQNLSHILTDQTGLIQYPSISQRITSKLQDYQTSIGLNVNSDTVSPVDTSILVSSLRNYANVNYEVGSASVGKASIIMQDDVAVELDAPTYTPYTMNNLVSALEGNDFQPDNDLPIFTASLKDSDLCLKPNVFTSVQIDVPDADPYDTSTWGFGLVGTQVGVTVDKSQTIINRFAESNDDLILDSISMSKGVANPFMNDRLWVLPEVHKVNKSQPILTKSFAKYVPCAKVSGSTPEGYVSLAVVLSNIANNSYKNFKGKTQREFYESFSQSNITYVFYEISEGQYENVDYVAIAKGNNANIIAYAYDAYFYKVDFETSVGGLGIASCISGNNALTYENQFEGIQDGTSLSGIVGKVLRVSNGLNSGSYIINSVDTETRTMFLDRSLDFSSMPISNKGLCVYSSESQAELRIYGSAGTNITNTSEISYTGNSDLVSGVEYGITTRYMQQADVGRYITLYNHVLDTVSGIIRENIGSYAIESIENVYRNSPYTGNQTIAYQKITVNVPSINVMFGSDVPDVISLPFILTDQPAVNTISQEDGSTSISPIVAFQIFEPNKREYRIVGASVSGSTMYVSQSTSPHAPSESTDSLFIKREGSNINFTLDRNNPLISVRPGKMILKNHSQDSSLYTNSIDVQTIGSGILYNSLSDKVFTCHNERMQGHSFRVDDSAKSFSTYEVAYLECTPIVNDVSVLNSTAEITSFSSKTITTSQGIFSNSLDRVVCSDTIAKRMLPCFIGVNIEYVGGPSEDIVGERLVRIINNWSESSISTSALIREIHKLGATRVILPIHVYYVVEDLDRKRHYRVIKDVLRLDDNLEINGTPRIVSRSVAAYGSTKLGASVKVTRVSPYSTLGQGGSI